MPAKSDYYKPAQTPLEMAPRTQSARGRWRYSPPADLTPDQALAARVKKVASNFQDFLAKIGGKIKTKAEADVAANYATKFGDFKSLAEAPHKVEKEPFLSKGREVDARWLPTARRCGISPRRRAEICESLVRRRKSGARGRGPQGQRDRAPSRRGRGQDHREPVDAIAEVKAEKVSIGTAKAITGRAKTIWQVTDPKPISSICARHARKHSRT